MQNFETIDEVVSNAFTTIPNSSMEDRVIARQWVYLAEKKMGVSSIDIKEMHFPVEDFAIKKPIDMVSPIDIVLMDGGGNQYGVLLEAAQSRIATPTSRFQKSVNMSQDNNYFYVDTMFPSITQAKIRYYAIPIDAEGEMMIKESHTMAIIFFIRYMYSLKTNKPDESMYSKWLMEAARAKSHDKMPSVLEAHTIASRWMSMIDANINRYKQF